jgi:hypothetical protein
MSLVRRCVALWEKALTAMKPMIASWSRTTIITTAISQAVFFERVAMGPMKLDALWRPFFKNEREVLLMGGPGKLHFH